MRDKWRLYHLRRQLISELIFLLCRLRCYDYCIDFFFQKDCSILQGIVRIERY